MKENNKIRLLALSLVLIVTMLGISFSYAFWEVSSTQENKNTATSKCFSVAMTESGEVHLTEAYPIYDSEEMILEPYSFTITNTCEITASYDINLETLNTSTIDSNYIKAALNDNTPQIVGSATSTTPTLSNASSSNTLYTSTLTAGSSVTYNLRLWVADSATPSVANNKTYASKIVVVSVATP